MRAKYFGPEAYAGPSLINETFICLSVSFRSLCMFT